MTWLTSPRWSPYIVGIGIGVLSWLTFLLSDQSIGCSTPYSRVGGMVEWLFRREKALKKTYFQEVTPSVTWDMTMVVGILIGAFLSAQLSGVFHLQWVPDTWSAAFGAALAPRLLAALAGGFALGLGARWADGCTSGHGISGTLQLTISSWLASIAFFVGGILTAMLIFRVIGG